MYNLYLQLVYQHARRTQGGHDYRWEPYWTIVRIHQEQVTWPGLACTSTKGASGHIGAASWEWLYMSASVTEVAWMEVGRSWESRCWLWPPPPPGRWVGQCSRKGRGC